MTLSELRTHFRYLVDQPYTAILGNTYANAIINDAAREIYQEILRRHPQYLHKSSSISTTASTPYTALPTDCVMVNKIINSSNETLPRFDLTQMDTTESSAQPVGFDITGPNVFWWPTPNAVYAHTIYYHYIPADMSADANSPTLPYGYHDAVSYGAAVKSRMIKDEQIREFMMTYENKLNLLLRAVAVGQTNEAPRVKGAYHDHYIYD